MSTLNTLDYVAIDPTPAAPQSDPSLSPSPSPFSPPSPSRARSPRSNMAVICSLYPAPFSTRRAQLPTHDYTIPGCTDLSKPAVLTIFEQDERYYVGRDNTAVRTWTAQEIAEDVAGEWRRGAFGRGGEDGGEAAVWVSPGAKYIDGQWHIPTAEIEYYRSQQEPILRRLYLLARRQYEVNKEAPLPVMLRAAEMLQIQGEPWQTNLASTARFHCPYCDAINSKGVAVCANCKNVLDIEKYMALQAQITQSVVDWEALPKHGIGTLPIKPKTETETEMTAEAETAASEAAPAPSSPAADEPPSPRVYTPASAKRK